MLYFAYGSNLNLSHLANWLQKCRIQDVPRLVTSGSLHDHRLRTNYIASAGLGAANIEPAEGWSVEGLLFRITPAIHVGLRAKEGWPVRYEEIDVLVSVSGRRRRVRASTYRVAPKLRLPFDAPVSCQYRKLILDGAKEARFSAEYQDYLSKCLVTPPMIRVAMSRHRDVDQDLLQIADA